MTYWLILCVIMAVRETSDDVFDPDFDGRNRAGLFLINMLAWHYWFVIDCLALWNARK